MFLRKNFIYQICAFVLMIGLSTNEIIGQEAENSVLSSKESDLSSTINNQTLNLPIIDGAQAPLAPEVVTRDETGRVTMRATRIEKPLELDGRLDEAIYQIVPGVSDFIQQEPREGQPATEQTEVWIFFDDENLYVAARCWDSSNPDRWVVNELQRDGEVTANENISIQLDTFYDRRNGFYFQTSPASPLRDQLFTDEGNRNDSWNTIWDVRSGQFDGGWITELVIPFKSLRYPGSGPQIWGVSFRRVVKWKNEVSHLNPVPASYDMQGVFRASTFGTLVGLETPSQSMNLEIKPYVTASTTTDRSSTIPLSNDFSSAGGFDLKYGLSRSLTADFTYNTDFSQVEEDVQQVNLTRFGLLFPEKREFFLEGQGIFLFGGAPLRSQWGSNNDVPILFFSRRIGLHENQSVPVVAGGRLTGKAGGFSIGAISIRTNDKPSANAVATNFNILRLKRDVFRRSNIGILATHRSRTIANNGSNLAFGIDANLQFFQNLAITSYYAKTQTPGLRNDSSSYRGLFNYSADRYGLQFERIMVGENFNPEVGFARRTNFQRDSLQLRFSPRLPSSLLIRKLYWQANFDYITNASGKVLENKNIKGSFRIDFNNSDQWNFDYNRIFEYLPEEFTISANVPLPSGAYRYQFIATSYNFGRHRMLSGRVSANKGSFYGGHRTSASISGGQMSFSRHFSLEPSVTLNWIDLPQGNFQNRLLTLRTVIMPSPRMIINSLVQYNKSRHSLNSSIRFRWEYTPGSELFIVYSEGRDTFETRIPELSNKSVVIKINRLFRF